MLVATQFRRCDNSFGKLQLLFAHTHIHSVVCDKLNNCNFPNKSSRGLIGWEQGCKQVGRINKISSKINVAVAATPSQAFTNEVVVITDMIVGNRLVSLYDKYNNNEEGLTL